MPHFALVLEQSRKAKAARNVYDYLRGRLKDPKRLIAELQLEGMVGTEGIRVDPGDKYRVLNVRLHDEYLSPFFRTDMNLFQLLMIDEHTEMSVYRAEKGWLFVFEGLAPGPSPFGTNGFDMR
ncbi:hypothetical protein NZD89_13845 [Alicyclobacillus fastidiosus]|uniref:Uncharacterized protein n=1 Tax=Alicyclobacillus fastidiosus TaxID=392011 RepID=A0ABY6ZNF7_9BACL|nr:hypothetical protein [Alicyclobacillus fastidiosus]WAH44371.1 hypothetical protein NZD89_13845 [Alicyclobacillus fastidiosus]GMA60704.1 hypothetical protein GCM10025859_11440 [Alicyclobacillus fastidiosus]